MRPLKAHSGLVSCSASQFEDALKCWTSALKIQQQDEIKFEVLAGRAKCYTGAPGCVKDCSRCLKCLHCIPLGFPARWDLRLFAHVKKALRCQGSKHVSLPLFASASGQCSRQGNAVAYVARVLCARCAAPRPLASCCSNDMLVHKNADYASYLKSIPAAHSECAARFALEPQQLAKQGLTDADRVIVAQPENHQAHLCRAEALLILEEYASAEQALLLALSIDAECDRAQVRPLS